ncbi:hypothetical protein A8E19_33280 [Burkholderia cenocepacia]|nr:hypothetical protein A8E19_33280 [Burkholderia cenocepacia]
MQSKATREAHAGTVDALVSFMDDCRFCASGLTAATVSLALEYVYQPHPRFWRDFNIAFLVRALTLCVPDWRAADLPPANRASRSLVKFVFGEEDEHEEALYGTANHRVSEGSRGRYAGQGTVQEARVQ